MLSRLLRRPKFLILGRPGVGVKLHGTVLEAFDKTSQLLASARMT
jgi:hypothetical protein